MAQRTMTFSIRYATHLPVLLQAMRKTGGDVLELGMGIFSTPLLHWWCHVDRRRLVSYDNSWRYLNWAVAYDGPEHEVHFVDYWDEADIEREWDVVLVDHSPSGRRVEEIRRLANLAKYMVIHDTNGRYNREYHFDTIWPLFREQLNFDGAEPSTSVVSNLMSLEGFWK